MTFPEFFSTACGPDRQPYDYQSRLACGERQEGQPETLWLTQPSPCESRLINIPTGLGKTAAVVLSWLWNRVAQPDATARQTWPRRLVYCLPMRTLVEQTRDEAEKWLKAHRLLWDGKGTYDGKVGLHILMGGEDAGEWDIHPERDAILIGTQDMLLISSSLMGILHTKLKSNDLDISSSVMRKLDAPPASGPPALPAQMLLRLSWTHLIEMLGLADPWQRAFYENECLKANWSVRQLQRQIGSLLYERTGLSTDKQAVIEHARQQALEAPADLIRDPYLLEFSVGGPWPLYPKREISPLRASPSQIFGKVFRRVVPHHPTLRQQFFKLPALHSGELRRPSQGNPPFPVVVHRQIRLSARRRHILTAKRGGEIVRERQRNFHGQIQPSTGRLCNGPPHFYIQWLIAIKVKPAAIPQEPPSVWRMPLCEGLRMSGMRAVQRDPQSKLMLQRGRSSGADVEFTERLKFATTF